MRQASSIDHHRSNTCHSRWLTAGRAPVRSIRCIRSSRTAGPPVNGAVRSFSLTSATGAPAGQARQSDLRKRDPAAKSP
jgi:hypothetical protein